MHTPTTLICVMIAAGLTGCAGQAAHLSSWTANRSLKDTVLVCEQKTTSARFNTATQCVRVDRAQLREMMLGRH